MVPDAGLLVQGVYFFSLAILVYFGHFGVMFWVLEPQLRYFCDCCCISKVAYCVFQLCTLFARYLLVYKLEHHAFNAKLFKLHKCPLVLLNFQHLPQLADAAPAPHVVRGGVELDACAQPRRL